MKVLVGCEESQAVTKELRKLGHEAFSCDILHCSGGKPEWHIKGNIIPILKENWDLLIAFPPCTHLAVSGARHFPEKIKDGRQQQGIDFFILLMTCKIPRRAIENPGGIMSTVYRRPDQIIQPFEYGDPARKTTCLWLKDIPKLIPTEIVAPELITAKNGEKYSKLHYETFYIKDRQERSKIRSKTFQGIADAMAEQWSNAIYQPSMI